MRTAIHQPNFFPWLGYFHRIQEVDQFIFFDHVALPGGRTIVQRVKILAPQGPTWLTMPIEKSGLHGQRLCEARMRDSEVSFSTLFNKLRNYYVRAPFTRQVLPFLETLKPRTQFLGAYNRFVIEAISREIGLNTTFLVSSEKPELLASEALKTEMILETCASFEVTDYLSGKGCLEFLEVDAFAGQGIHLAFQEFHPPNYDQRTPEFVGGLSILDALFHLGFEGTAELLQSASTVAALS